MSRTWGTTPEERSLAFPCDRHLAGIDDAYFRGVTVQASPATIFRWLCQLRVAPYSYDWLDNFGRTSPRALTLGLENLSVGQHFVLLFALVEFEASRQLTIRTRRDTDGRTLVERLVLWLTSSRLAPEIAITLLIVPQDASRSRLLMKQALRGPPGLFGRVLRGALAWVDLLMARRQLLNLRDLAERTRGREAT